MAVAVKIVIWDRTLRSLLCVDSEEFAVHIFVVREWL